MISEHFPGKVLLLHKDSGGRIVSLPVSFNDVKYNFVNIMHPPILQISNPFLKLKMNSFSQPIS